MNGINFLMDDIKILIFIYFDQLNLFNKIPIQYIY